MVTKEQALALTLRDELHYGTCTVTVGPRGGSVSKTEVWRVNGAVKVWKTRPDDFSVPLKYGYNGPYSYLDQNNTAEFHLEADCQPTITQK